MVKKAKNVAKTSAKFLMILPFAGLAYEYYKTRSTRETAYDAMECFAWPAGVFVVKQFNPSPL